MIVAVMLVSEILPVEAGQVLGTTVAVEVLYDPGEEPSRLESFWIERNQNSHHGRPLARVARRLFGFACKPPWGRPTRITACFFV